MTKVYNIVFSQGETPVLKDLMNVKIPELVCKMEETQKVFSDEEDFWVIESEYDFNMYYCNDGSLRFSVYPLVNGEPIGMTPLASGVITKVDGEPFMLTPITFEY